MMKTFLQTTGWQNSSQCLWKRAILSTKHQCCQNYQAKRDFLDNSSWRTRLISLTGSITWDLFLHGLEKETDTRWPGFRPNNICQIIQLFYPLSLWLWRAFYALHSLRNFTELRKPSSRSFKYSPPSCEKDDTYWIQVMHRGNKKLPFPPSSVSTNWVTTWTEKETIKEFI